MAEKKTQTSPAGIAGWVCINKPSDKFKADGEYSIKLNLTPEEAAPLIAQFQKLAEEAKAEFIKKEPKKAGVIGKYNLHVPGSPETDKEGNETGNIAFQFKQTALIRPKDPKKQPFAVKVGIFDAKGKPMASEIVVGRGSRVKVAYEVVPFKMDATKSVGVSLRLKAVQVLELVRYSGTGDADSFGFGEEDGYTTEEAPAASEGGESSTPPDGDF